MTLGADPPAWQATLAAAFSTADASAGDLPVDRVRIDFKGDEPRIHIFTGKPAGGEDREFVLDATTGELLGIETCADEPLIKRIHGGEVYGDGGFIVAMVWGPRARGAYGHRHHHLPADAAEECDRVEARVLVIRGRP